MHTQVCMVYMYVYVWVGNFLSILELKDFSKGMKESRNGFKKKTYLTFLMLISLIIIFHVILLKVLILDYFITREYTLFYEFRAQL